MEEQREKCLWSRTRLEFSVGRDVADVSNKQNSKRSQLHAQLVAVQLHPYFRALPAFPI